MGFRLDVVAKTREDLIGESNPGVTNQPEAVPWVFYDTLTYIDNATTELNFFQNPNNDRSLSNLKTGGQLTEPQFFEIQYFGCDFLFGLTDSAVAASAHADLAALLVTGRPFWQFEQSDKVLGPFPLTFCHASGGVTGEFMGFDNVAAGGTPSMVSVPNSGYFDGGFCTGNSIVIPPKVGFGVTVRWPAAVDIAGNILIRFWMAGALHRRVN